MVESYRQEILASTPELPPVYRLQLLSKHIFVVMMPSITSDRPIVTGKFRKGPVINTSLPPLRCTPLSFPHFDLRTGTLASDLLFQDQFAAAVRTDSRFESGRFRVFFGLSRCNLRRMHIDQFATQCNLLLPMSPGQKTEVPDLLETLG